MASHWVVMNSSLLVIGLIAVICLILVVVWMTTRGGGYSDSSHHDHGDRYVDPKTGEMTSDDDYDDHDGD